MFFETQHILANTVTLNFSLLALHSYLLLIVKCCVENTYLTAHTITDSHIPIKLCHQMSSHPLFTPSQDHQKHAFTLRHTSPVFTFNMTKYVHSLSFRPSLLALPTTYHHIPSHHFPALFFINAQRVVIAKPNSGTGNLLFGPYNIFGV